MIDYAQGSVAEAFNSMLRTDYISLNDMERLNLLSRYYVDYFGVMPEVLFRYGSTDCREERHGKNNTRLSSVCGLYGVLGKGTPVECHSQGQEIRWK